MPLGEQTLVQGGGWWTVSHPSLSLLAWTDAQSRAGPSKPKSHLSRDHWTKQREVRPSRAPHSEGQGTGNAVCTDQWLHLPARHLGIALPSRSCRITGARLPLRAEAGALHPQLWPCSARGLGAGVALGAQASTVWGSAFQESQAPFPVSPGPVLSRLPKPRASVSLWLVPCAPL